MSLLLPGETVPVYPPERVAPGQYSGFFDYSNGPDDRIFIIVSCAWQDTGGFVFDLGPDAIPEDGEGEGGVLVGVDALSSGTFKDGVDYRETYTRDVVTPVDNALQAGRLVVEHFIEN